jgi:hypothetical protein
MKLFGIKTRVTKVTIHPQKSEVWRLEIELWRKFEMDIIIKPTTARELFPLGVPILTTRIVLSCW